MPVFDPNQLARWCGGTWSSRPPAPLAGVSHDTRALRPGELYVALAGERFDGHDFVAAAFRAGAAAALVNADAAPRLGAAGPLLAVPDTRRALLDLAAGHRATLGAALVAVTGSVGKSTVKEMLADCLAAAAPTARTRGNWNNDIGLPLSLLAMPATDRYGVFEVGMNHPGELEPLCRVLRPQAGVITEVGLAHMEFFDSVAAIAREKAAVFRALPADGFAVACRDPAWFEAVRADARCPVVTISMAGDADYALAGMDGESFAVRERSSGERHDFTAPWAGDFIVHNALLAIAVARRFGLGWAPLAAAIRGYRPLPLRWRREAHRGVAFVVDCYNANPLSMKAALSAFARAPAARRWLVLGGMRELGAVEAAEHRALGAAVAGGGWAGLIAVGPLAGLIADGAAAAGLAPDRLVRCGGAAAAARALAERATAGDAVLLKASRGERLEDVLAEWLKITGEGA